MKYINSLTDSVCRLVVTLQQNPAGALFLLLLASCTVAAGWAWRR